MDESLVGWDRVRSVMSKALPSWVPPTLAEAWCRFGLMSEDEREVFLQDLVAFEGGLEDRDQADELKRQQVALFHLACANDLAKVMSENEGGRPVELGEALNLIAAALAANFERERDYARRHRVVPAPILETKTWDEYFASWYGAGTAYSVISATRNNFIHLASGEKPRRFGRGWKEKRR